MSLLQIGRGVVATAASVVGLAVVVPSPVNAVPQVRGVPASSGAFWPLNPIRIVDTRSGVGAAVGKIAPGGEIRFQVSGANGVPAGPLRWR